MKIDNLRTDDFIFDAPTGVEKARAERANMQANRHLVLQFPIPELRYYFHPTFPGRWTLVHAQSHNFKTEWVNFWSKVSAVELSDQMDKGSRRGVIIKISTEDAIEGLIESQIASFGGGELKDIAQGIIKNPQEFLKAEIVAGGLPIVHIGESLGMEDSNAALLSLSNIAKLIKYVKYDHFGEETPIAGIFCDYLQALPMDIDTAVGKNFTDNRTLQINRDIDTFRRICKQFYAPGVMVAQSSPDDSLSTIGESIKIPGYWDIHWSKYPAQRADYEYALWMPKMHYPIGEWVDSNKKKELSRWNFEVSKNMLWIKAHKHKKFPNVGASFPLKVSQNGNVSLDKELYERIAKMEQ